MMFRVLTGLAVLALAAGTWLLSNPGSRTVDSGSASQPDLPGYYLKDAVLTDYDAGGAPALRIRAQRIEQVDHGEQVALYDVRVDYQGGGGENWVLFGDVAHVQPGGTVIDVTGNVRLEGAGTARPDRATMRTDALRYDVASGVASTKSDVRIDFGPHTLTARGMVADLKEQTLRLESKVNGRFLP